MEEKEEKEKQNSDDKKNNDEEKSVKKSGNDFGIDIQEMKKAGVHFGHQTSRLHPKMKPYLSSVKNTIHFLDLEKTIEKFEQALEFIQEIAKENKVLLLVGTKIQVKDLVKDFASKVGNPYICERWLGGTLTNFNVILKRIEHFISLEKQKESGELEKYTKKERIKIDKEFQKLKTKFEGLKDLKQLPDAILVLDIKKDILAVKEAKIKGIKVIGICDTNVDPSLVDYPILANDDAISSVKYILDKIQETMLKAK